MAFWGAFVQCVSKCVGINNGAVWGLYGGFDCWAMHWLIGVVLRIVQ